MEPSGRVLLAVLCFNLAVCVLGRPQPSSATPQYSTVEVFGNSSLQGSDHILGILHFGTVEVPWRRSLKRKHHNGGLHFQSGGRGGRGVYRGGGGGGGLNRTYSIIVVVSIVAFVLLLIALSCWCGIKKSKNPNWRPTDCFKRNKLPREKMITPVQSDVDLDVDAEHKVGIDGPRQDHTVKV